MESAWSCNGTRRKNKKNLLRPATTPGDVAFNAGAFFSASGSLHSCVHGENILEVKNGKEKESKIKRNFSLANSYWSAEYSDVDKILCKNFSREAIEIKGES